MSHVTRCCLALKAILLASSLGSASQSPIGATLPAPAVGCEGLPSALVVHDPRLRFLILDMRRRAPTFRRQLVRLMDQPGLVVTVSVWQVEKAAGIGARTRLTLLQGRLRAADVLVRTDSAGSVSQLIAHEFEHILEQLDGIDLAHWVGHGGVYRVSGASDHGPIETERARRLGRIVADEYAAERGANPPCGGQS